MEKKPVLSIGMIFKNEARCIERSLESLRSLREAVPCELIMADTGSTDGSRAIAERYADDLIDFPWADDFAAARNAVLERCSGTWHLQFDCDEWLDGDISELVRFLKEPSRKSGDGGLLVVRNYNTADLREFGDLSIMRLIRRAPGRRFTGRVHEHWNFKCRDYAVLNRTVLHHDGYVFVSEAVEKAKMDRNMALLRKELAEHPGDLLLLLQSMDSTMGEDRRAYAKQATRAVLDKEERWESCGPAIFRTAAVSAQAFGWPEAEEWLAQARELFPRSLYTRIDISYYEVIRFMGAMDFATAARRAEEYLEALEEYRSGRARAAELASSHIMCLSPLREVRTRINLAKARCLLRQYEASVAALDAADFSKLDLEGFNVTANTLLLLHANCELDLSGLVRRLREEARDVPEEVRRAVLRNLALRTSDDPAELAELQGDVEDWNEVPITALIHALDRGMPFPLRPMNLEEMDALAARLAENKEAVRRLALAAKTDTPQALCWARALVLAAVQSLDWANGGDLDLARRFAEVENAFLPLCYAPETLTEERMFLLPSLHRFGWWCARAFQALDGGDALGYVRLLRSGLETNPGAGPMVEYLTENTPELQAPPPPPELLALAEQVRTLLAAYGPDDPAVQAIKESPVYQRVAYLIEGDSQ